MRMDNSKDKPSWILGESVGTWLTRRLKEEFDKLPDSQKISEKGNLIDAKAWLSNKTMIDKSTLSDFEKSEALHLSREDIRKKLSKFLGYYGYPIYEDRRGSTEHNSNIVEQVTRDFRELFDKLKTTELTCPFCEKDPNYFLDRDYKKISRRSNPAKKLYLSSHNYRQFGVAQEKTAKGSFQLEILICEKCVLKNEKLLTAPISKIIKELQGKFPELNLNYNMIAKITDVSESMISRIATGKTYTIDPSLQKKIIGLWLIGNLKPIVLPKNYEYKECMEDAVKVVLGEIALDEDFLELYGLHWAFECCDYPPKVEDGFKLEKKISFRPLELSYDIEGVYVTVKAEYVLEKHIQDWIWVIPVEQTLLLTLATPDSNRLGIEVINTYVGSTERVC
jgi:hypothetical protein